MNEIATTSPGPIASKKTLQDLMMGQHFRDAVAKSLPKHCSPDRFLRVALTTVNKVPKLLQCEQASFFNALLTCSQLGLEPDGRRAHLIPFENRKRGVVECQLLIDYKGLVELVMGSGAVSSIHADVICDGDTFEYDMGRITAHKIDFRKPRGEVYAAYAVARLNNGDQKAEVMSVDDIQSIRARSRYGDSGPWVTDWNEMAKKTVFRRLSKWLPLTPEARDAIEAEDSEEARFASAKPIPVSSPHFLTAPQPPPEFPGQQADPGEPVPIRRGPGRPRKVEATPEPPPPPAPKFQAKLEAAATAIGLDYLKAQKACNDAGLDGLGVITAAGWSQLPDAQADWILANLDEVAALVSATA